MSLFLDRVTIRQVSHRPNYDAASLSVAVFYRGYNRQDYGQWGYLHPISL